MPEKREITQQENPVQITTLVIPQESIDEYGHVNYKQIPSLLEQSQDQYMNDRGIGFALLQENLGIKSFVKANSSVFKQQLLLGDSLTVETKIGHIGNTSFSFNQQIIKEEKVAVEYSLTVVCVDENDTPISLSKDFKESLLSDI